MYLYKDLLSKTVSKPTSTLNLLHVYANYKLKRVKLDSFPAYIQLETTNKCNLNCEMCYRKLQNRKIGEVTFEDFKKIIDQFPYLLIIDLQGWGEPFLCKDLFKMIEYLNKRGVITGFSTNGTLLNEDSINKIINSNLTSLVFSIDSAAPEKIRNYKNFDKMVENIKLLSENIKFRGKNKPVLSFSTTLMKENLKDIPSVIQLAKDVGVKFVTVHNVTIYDPIQKGTGYDTPSTKEIKEKLSEASSLGKSLDINVKFTGYFAKKSFWKEEEIKGLCKFVWGSCFISWDGFVYPCCHYFEHSFGNIFETPFKDIWNGKEYQEFRKQLIKRNFQDSICQNCEEIIK